MCPAIRFFPTALLLVSVFPLPCPCKQNSKSKYAYYFPHFCEKHFLYLAASIAALNRADPTPLPQNSFLTVTPRSNTWLIFLCPPNAEEVPMWRPVTRSYLNAKTHYSLTQSLFLKKKIIQNHPGHEQDPILLLVEIPYDGRLLICSHPRALI